MSSNRSGRTRLDHGDTDIDGYWDGGGGNERCDWQDSVCTETPTHSYVSFCDDPECPDRHTSHLCARHYVVEMSKQIDHILQCPEYTGARGREARKQAVYAHIAAWGQIEGP